MPDRKLFFLIPLFIISLLAGGAPPADASSPLTPEQQVEKIQDKYRALTSLSFDFSQVTRTGGRERRGAGNAVLYRPINKPGVMRWNYTNPDTQIILNDGSRLSIYTKTDNQLIVTSAEELQSDITYAFFAGTRNLLDDFTARPADTRFIFRAAGQKDIQAVQLVPRKPHPQVKALHLWFNQDFLIRKLILEDHFDSVTELSFTNIRLNTLTADSEKALTDLLRLDLPPNTEVISQ
jgi:outer membrane lipoprotein carrier protein